MRQPAALTASRTDAMPILHAALTCRGAERLILGPVQVSLQAGCTAILGPNGSGKSTLLQALAGLLPSGIKLEGEVHFQAQALKSMSLAQRARSIAWLAQDAQGSLGAGHGSFQTSLLTVQGLVDLASIARLGWMAQTDLATSRFISEALEVFDLLKLRHQALQHISGGELQRAQLARVFAVHSEVLILDEPDNHLDLKHLSRLEQAMQNSSATCIVYSTHDLNFALRADHLVLMKQGLISERIALAHCNDAALEKSLSACFETGVRIIRHEQVRSVVRA